MSAPAAPYSHTGTVQNPLEAEKQEAGNVVEHSQVRAKVNPQEESQVSLHSLQTVALAATLNGVGDLAGADLAGRTVPVVERMAGARKQEGFVAVEEVG